MQQGGAIIATQRAESSMLDELKPRQFSETQFNAFVESLRGHVKTLTVYSRQDAESGSFAYEMAFAFQKAGASVRIVPISDDMKLPIPKVGQTLYVPSSSIESDPEMRTLTDAFVRCPVRGSVVHLGEPLPGVPVPSLFVMSHPVPLAWFPTFNGTPVGLPPPPWEMK